MDVLMQNYFTVLCLVNIWITQFLFIVEKNYS